MNNIKIISIIILFILSKQGLSQKYYEGKLEIGLLSVESSTDEPLSPELRAEIETAFQMEATMTVYFTKEKLSILKENPLNGKSREVYDLINRKLYKFFSIGDQDSYTSSHLPDDNSSEHNPLGLDDFGEAKKVEEKLFGLNCEQYEINNEVSNLKTVVTKDIEINKIFNISMMPSKYGLMLKMSIDDTNQGIVMTLGVKSFSPSIDDLSVFAMDTIGLVNQNKLLSDFSDAFTEHALQEKETLEKFGEYKTEGINNDIVENLISQGALDLENYSIKSILSDKVNIDIPSILLLPSYSGNLLRNMTQNEQKSILESAGIISPSIEKLFKHSVSDSTKITKESFYDGICIAAIKDHMEKSETKLNIVNNLQLMGLLSESETNISRSYVDGTSSLSDLMSTIPQLIQLKQVIVTSDDEISNHVSNFYKKIFEAIKVEIGISQENNFIHLKDGNQNYSININDLKNINYEQSYTDENQNEVIYNDSTFLNYIFYSKLLNPIKQIGSDHALGKSFNIYKLIPPHTNLIDSESYDLLTNFYPFLKMDNNPIFFQYVTSERYDLFTKIGTSFSYHPDNFDNQITLGEYEWGSFDGITEYITSDTKNAFIIFLNQNYESFSITKDQAKMKSDLIQSQLITNSDQLLNYLPNIKITVNTFFSETPKSEYTPRFSNDRDDFKDAYPSLYRVIKDDFLASNFYYNETEHKVHFEYNGENHSVSPGDNNMIKIISMLMKESTSGKRLYPVNRFSSFSLTEETYYYITPQQKNELSKILKLNF